MCDCCVFCFFKQKTAYEMRISDWSSDVCSSDLSRRGWPAMSDATKPVLELMIAAPRGFCAGVDRAIKIVELAIQKHGAPVYVRHEIVHNKFVVDSLKAKGAVFVEELDEVPDGATVVFSAHGVPKTVPADAEARGQIGRAHV